MANQKVISNDDGRNPLDSDFQELATGLLDEWHVPGLSIAVVDGNATWAAGYGHATLPATPATPSTLFYAGSTTKAFLAGALSLMIDAPEEYPQLGRLGWRTPIASLVRDDFVLMGGPGSGHASAWAQEHLTLEDALCHRTGFPRHDKSLGLRYGGAGPDGRGGDSEHRATVRDFTRSLRHLPMVAEPRTTWRYCNLMFMVVSHVVQTLTGRWVGDLFREHIWAPLGMGSTYLSLDDALAGPKHLSTPYYWDYDEGGFHAVPHLGLDEASGAGGAVSNVLDFAKWIRCTLDEAAPLSKKGHAAVKEPRMIIDSENQKGYDAKMTYALGWNAGTWKGHKVYTHSGGMEAYGTLVYFLPDLKYGVITMGNTALTSNFVGNMLIWKLIGDKLGIPESERYDWAASAKRSLSKTLSRFDTAVDDLYSDRAADPLPRALPLDRYAGTYHHPAYQNMTIEIADTSSPRLVKGKKGKRELVANRKDMVWPMMFEFEHVSGEFWVIFIDMFNAPNLLDSQVAKAEFKIGPTGLVKQLAIEFMEDGSEGVVVFDRVR